MPDPLKILHTASECAPFAKTGGLGDVLGALPKFLAERGHDVRVVLPLYRGIAWDDQELLEGWLEVPMGFGIERAGIRQGTLPGSEVPIYFIEHHRYFDREGIYGDAAGGYGDNIERFAFFSRATLKLCLALGWIPDVIHANDWQTALCPVYTNTVERERFWAAASVLTLHNLAHQGIGAKEAFGLLGLFPSHFSADAFEHDNALNLLKSGLRHATLLNTVSKTYAREIQTPQFGVGLDYVLRDRASDLTGILNGIDVSVWNPAVDPHIAAPYSLEAQGKKALCKAALQEELGLPVRADVPLFALIARLDPQKGVDVVASVLPRLLALEIQVCVLGTGNRDLEDRFAREAAERPDQFAAELRFDGPLSHRMEAGADFFLMPSRFEPCGLNQMYSLAYGTLPIVRNTGGLADTVQNYVEATGGGTGFVFDDLTENALVDVVGWAVSTWYDRPAHVVTMRHRAMEQDNSWDRSAGLYEALFRDAVTRRRG